MNLSPEVIAAEVKDDKVILTLDQPIQPGALNEFEIAGSDGRFVNVEATTVNGNQIELKSPINDPLKVRYAWKDNPLKANVRSLSGLPMSSFELNINN